MGRKKSSVGCLFWIALVLLVLVVFLFNRNTIETVLGKTGLLDYFARNQTQNEEPEVDIIIPDQPEATPEDIGTSSEDEDQTTTVVIEETPQEEPEEPQEQVEANERIRRSTLYFVMIEGSSSISLKGVTRPVNFIDAPLTDTLSSLLKGLSSSEINKGLLSLVPAGTEIRGVSVRNETAFIDFNESFRFNSFGREGYKYQLQQIVYTATEFQSVRSVQILIEGERISYLGPESPFVGDPLSRDSLS